MIMFGNDQEVIIQTPGYNGALIRHQKPLS